MSIEKKLHGLLEDGSKASIYTMKNANGMSVDISDFGATLLSINVADRQGRFADVCLGFEKLEDYTKRGPYFGATIGRVGNRIKNSCFELDGKTYQIAANDGANHLHGGMKGFDKRLWSVKTSSTEDKDSIELYYRSADMEEGYPGNLDVTVTYSLTNQNEIVIDYHAVTDKKTIVNLTNHAYFNLKGHTAGNILQHKVMIDADKFTANGPDSVPTGEIRDVDGTPMDFRALTAVGDRISEDYDQLKYGMGYDHNWIINRKDDELKLAAMVVEEKDGRCLEVYTTSPGIQFYSGNYLAEAEMGKDRVKYEKCAGLCLETQYYPNAIHCKHFPSPILEAGQQFNATTIYKFTVK